jgi:prepilin-type processing-associated H-X9-DG protein
MDDKLVGYLLHALEDGEARAVESYLETHPETRQQFQRLRRALEPLESDRDAPAPPADLVMRTLGRVAEHVCSELPKAPVPAPTAVVALRSWWRRADVLVAACLLVLTAGIGLPVLYRLNSQNSAAVTVACQNNLRQFYTALTTYRDQHGHFPDLAREKPRDVAGMVVPVLADAGTLPKDFSVRCPAVGPHAGCQFTLASLRLMPAEEFETKAPSLAMGYAYSLGYRDETGEYHGPGQNRVAASAWPILADRPPSEGTPGNSVNHGGTGQNVLFLDGHVRFATLRQVNGGEDDIFLNHERRVAAGVGPQDAVLGYSAARP